MLRAKLLRLLSHPCCVAASALLGLSAAAPQAHAQATVTASRNLGLSAFAGALGVHPEFGGSPNIYGFFLGANATRYFKFASPGLEVRFNDASGSVVSQRSFLIGLRVEHAFGPRERFRPYLNGLVGPGSTHFVDPSDPGYTQDNSLVLDAGAGLDFDLTSRFAVKGEFQIQHWHLGQESPVFSPEMFGVGLVYRPTFSRLSIR